MEFDIVDLSDRPCGGDLDISSVRRDVGTVAEELSKLPVPTEKTPGQLAEEIIAEIDSLHESVLAGGTAAPYFEDQTPICAECWTEWPCSTHRTIHGEDKCTTHLTQVLQSDGPNSTSEDTSSI